MQDKILNFIKVNGPCLPTQVSKNIGQNLLISSAYLAELRSQGKVELTDLKIGSSPLYYLKGQEDQLLKFLSGLKPQDREVLTRLGKEKVLREQDLELIEKVGLRSLKDFAVPIHVSYKGQKELFWKWYLVSEEKCNEYVQEILRRLEQENQPVEEAAEAISQKTPSLENDKATETTSKLENTTVSPKKSKSKDSVKAVQEEVESHERQETLATKTEKKTSTKKVTSPSKTKKTKTKRAVKKGTFLPLLEQYFSSQKIVVESSEVIRKNSEIDFLVKIPTLVGGINIFVKAKKKARCDEKDISAAYLESQMKRRPLLFLYAGSLTKKAEELVESDEFHNMNVLHIDLSSIEIEESA